MPVNEVMTPWLRSERKSSLQPARASLRAGAIDRAVVGERLVAHVEEDQRALARDLAFDAGYAEGLAQPLARGLAERVKAIDRVAVNMRIEATPAAMESGLAVKVPDCGQAALPALLS